MAGKFPLGKVVMTQGASHAFEDAGENALFYLIKHGQGDWGTLADEDKRANDAALHPADPQRILSAYHLSTGDKVWIITEWDRSATTILLPDEY